MTAREARIEIKRLKEHELWLTNCYIEELQDTKAEIKRLRKIAKKDK